MASEHGVSIRFEVSVEGLSLGNWTKCEGLAIEYEIQEYMEGGENGFVHRLPGRCKHPNVKLTRPIDQGTSQVASWVSGQQSSVARQTARIAVRDANGTVVGAWNLLGACPVRWTGPTLDITGTQVATETLELAHQGFTTE